MMKMRYAFGCYYLSHINWELPAIKLLLKMILTYHASLASPYTPIKLYPGIDYKRHNLWNCPKKLNVKETGL